jgi:hypothetical protein
MMTNTTHHVLNNIQWLHFIESSPSRHNSFSAIILTGWSRFDHFMPLCDLLPTAYTSLIYSLYALNTNQYLIDGPIHNCDRLLKSVDKDPQLCELLPGDIIRKQKFYFKFYFFKVFLFGQVYHLYLYFYQQFKIV